MVYEYVIQVACVQWKTPDDGQRNCPKHVEFHSKNKFEKLVHLVGFIIRLYHDAARSSECQMQSQNTNLATVRICTLEVMQLSVCDVSGGL